MIRIWLFAMLLLILLLAISILAFWYFDNVCKEMLNDTELEYKEVKVSFPCGHINCITGEINKIAHRKFLSNNFIVLLGVLLGMVLLLPLLYSIYNERLTSTYYGDKYDLEEMYHDYQEGSKETRNYDEYESSIVIDSHKNMTYYIGTLEYERFKRIGND